MSLEDRLRDAWRREAAGEEAMPPVERIFRRARRRVTVRVGTAAALLVAVAAVGFTWLDGPTGEVTIVGPGDDETEQPATEEPSEISVDPGPAACEPSEVGNRLMEAYNDRDVDTLRSVAGDATIDDPVGLTVDSDAGAMDVESWVELGAAHDDRFAPRSYTPVGPDAMRFEVVRTHPNLERHDLEALAVTYLLRVDAGCQVTEFSVDGPLIGRPDPCGLDGLVGDRDELVARPCREGVAGLGSRVRHQALAVDGQMWIWGGATDSTGGRPAAPLLTYDPGSQQWRSVDVDADDAHLSGTAHRIGDELVVVPNFTGDEILHVDPQTGSAERVTMPDYAQGAAQGQSVWTGSQLIVWGGTTVGTPPAAARYEPASGEWRRIADAPIPPRDRHSVVWTGSEMLVWGGSDGAARSDGAAYDPATDTWRTLGDAPLEPRSGHTAVWTGAEMIVWGGLDRELHGDGAVYDPDSDSWRPTAPAPIAARADHTATWADDRMTIWGGWSGAADPDQASHADGAAYDPQAATWHEQPDAPIGGRCHHTATTLAGRTIIFGGAPCDQHPHVAYHDGATLQPQTPDWTLLPPP